MCTGHLYHKEENELTDYQTLRKSHGKVSGLLLKQTLWDGVVTVSISQSYQAQTKPRGKKHQENKQSKVDPA